MPISPKDKGAAINAATLIFNRKVAQFTRDGRKLQTNDVSALAVEAAGEAAVLIYSVERHMAPTKRR